MGKLYVLILMVLSGFGAWSQDSVITSQTDSQPPKPVVRRPAPKPKRDTVARDTVAVYDSLAVSKIDRVTGIRLLPPPKTGFELPSHPIYRVGPAARLTSTKKERVGKEPLFYSMIGLLIFFAMIRNGFHRYVEDLFKSYFRTTVKQRQLKEQLIQSPLPSLLLNIFFLFGPGIPAFTPCFTIVCGSAKLGAKLGCFP